MSNRACAAAPRRTGARILLLCYDACALLVCAALLSLAFTAPAFAYVDPSVMTYTIQAIAGVAVALSAVAGVAFRRTRKTLMKVLHIDENAKKDKDTPWERIPRDASNVFAAVPDVASDEVAELYRANEALKAKRREGAKLTWPKKFALAFLVLAFAVCTVEVVAPFEIVAGAYDDLTFGLGDIWWIMLLFALGVAAVAALIVSFFPDKAFTVALVLLFSVGLCCYIQTLLLNGGLPVADGREVNWWGDHAFMMVISALIWLCLLAVPAVLCRKNYAFSRLAVCALSAALIIVQGIGVASLFLSSGDEQDSPHGRAFVTEDGLFTVSDKGNVIVFVLDCYDTVRLQEALAEAPTMLDEMNGFTWYQNNAGVMIPTAFAVPYLLTGEMPEDGQSVTDYLSERYTNSTFLEEMHASNWSIGLYTDTFGMSRLTKAQRLAEVSENSTNIHPIGTFAVSTTETVKILTKCALYRDMPWVLKDRFRFYTDELNTRVIESRPDAAPSETIYSVDDRGYYDKLLDLGLSMDEGAYEGAFRFIHLAGAHVPFNYDENMNFVGEGKSTQVKQAIGCMKIVDAYLRELKDMGLYDDATIIITSDHGDWVGSMDKPNYATEPIMLVKESGADSSKPISVSLAPVSHKDFHATVLDAMGLDYANYGTRFEDVAEDAARERYMFQITHESNSHIRSLLLYYINGDVRDFANWTYSGKEWLTDYDNNLQD